MIKPSFKKRLAGMKQYLSPFYIIAFILLFLYCLSLVAALFWAIISSMKGRIDYMINPYGLPAKFMFENYLKAFSELSVPISTSGGTREVFMWELFLNTLMYSVGCTILATLSPCIVAYAVAKYKFKLGKIIYAFVIVTMLLPIVGSLPSEMLVVKALGFYDNMIGVWIMKSGFLGMHFLIFYATWKSFSWDYAEAAFMDGASNFTVLTRVMLPLARTTISAILVLNFITFWNEYYTQLLYLPSFPSVSYGLWRFSYDPKISTIPIKLAGSVIVCMPVLCFYLIFRNKLVGNIAVGGIKG